MRPQLAAAAAAVAVTFALPAAAQPPSLAHAKQQFDARNYDAAKPELVALTRANPADVAPVLLLGRIALNQNDVDEAVYQFEHCVEIDDANADCHFWLGNALGNAAQRANKLKQGFLARRVKTEFERAVALDPNRVDARLGLVQFYMRAPGFMGGSMDKAREQAGQVEKINRHRGAIAWGSIADNEKDIPAAEDAYKRAITIAPDSTSGYFALLGLYVREKRWTDAFTTVDRAIARLPEEKAFLMIVARLAGLSGEQLPRGEAAAKQWLAAPPKEAGDVAKASAHVRLGTVYEKMGRVDAARAEYEVAVGMNPKSEEARKALEQLKR